MSNFQQEIIRHAKKQEYMAHTQKKKKKQSIGAVPEEAQIKTLNQLL